jgi:hypothetical protein
MGRIVDRTQEHLCSSDNAIIIARKKLLKAIADVQADIEPAGVDPAHHCLVAMLITGMRLRDCWASVTMGSYQIESVDNLRD